MIGDIGNAYYEIYKYGVEKRIPIRYIFFNGTEIEDATQIFEGNLQPGVNLSKVYSVLRLFLKEIPKTVIAFLYYKFSDDTEDIKQENIEQYYQTFTEKSFGRTIFKFGDFQKEFITFEEDWLTDLNKEEMIFNSQTLRYQEIKSTNYNPIQFPEEQFRETTTSHFYPLLRGELIEKDDAFEIFNQCKADKFIPYIHWKDDRGNNFYKVYSPLSGEDAPQYKLLKQKIRPQPNRIYFYLFLSTSRISRDSYVLAEINLEDSIVEVEYSKTIAGIKGEDYVVEKFNEVFDLTIDSESRKEVNFSGKLYFDPFSINQDLLYFIVTTNPLFSSFYVSEDKDELLPEPRMIFKYRGFRGYRPTYANKRLDTSASVEFYLSEKKTIQQKVYFEVVVTNAIGELEYRSFREELAHLFGYYLENFEEYRNIIETQISEDYETISSITFDSTSVKAFYNKKLSLLKDKAKDIFTGGSRKVQCKDQPVIIEKDDVDDWKALTINGEERDILYFPPTPKEGDETYPGERQFIFVCPDDSNPYPQLKQIKTAAGETTKYPLMPICHERKMDISYLYNNFYRFRKEGYIPEEGGAPKENVTVTQKIRRFMEEGELPASLDNYFTTLLGYSFRRIGTDISPNSMISCCLMAIEKENFTSLPASQRMLKSENLRLSMIGKEYLMKQELFDEPIEEIRRRITDLNSFFDSYLYYRGLEEVLDINIFIFVVDQGSGYFEIPRNTSTHIRIPRNDRKSVLLFKNFGSENEPLQYPHYEFISVVEPENYYLIYDSFIGVQTSYLWDSGITRISPYSRLDWNLLLPNAFSQFIDGYGKTRIINVTTSSGEKISVFTLPTQPLDLKIDDRIYEATHSDVENYFSQNPSAVNKEGFFFRIFDYEKGIFVPVKKIKTKEVTTKAPKPFDIENRVSEFTEYKMVKRSAAILKECIIWCWRNDALHITRSFEDWFSVYIYEDTSLPEIFYPKEVNISFPVMKARSTEKAVELISGWWDGIFRDRRIYLPTNLYDRIYNHLKDIARETDGKDIQPEKYLNSEIKNSFISFDNNIILLDTESYLNYIRNVQEQQNNYINSFVRFSDPFPQLIKILDGKIYIVQDLNDGKLKSALKLCEMWNQKGINNGSKTVGDKPESSYKYGVYVQTPDTKIIPFEDKTGGEEKYLQVLRFENNYYSLLQLY